MFSAFLFSVALSKDEEINWQQIKLIFDLSQLDQSNTITTCNVNQTYLTWNGSAHSCTSVYTPSDTKKKNLEKTLAAVNEFITSFLRVSTDPAKITLTDMPNTTVGLAGEYKDPAHLVIHVITRPFMISGQNNANRMFGYITSKDSTTHRPTSGIIALDTAYYDDFEKGFSNSTYHNYYYQKLLALTFRIMGLDSTCFNEYHPYDSNEPHNKDGNTCTVTNQYNKTFTYLKTPFAQTFFTNHYQTERADYGNQDCYGIELDDFAGRDDILDDNQILSSPTSRVYYSDLNAYASFYSIPTDRINANLDKRITDVTIVMLRDTGFYQINYLKGYPLIWGNSETGVTFNNFSTGSPRFWPPASYYVTNDQQGGQTPSFDFRRRLISTGLPTTKITCPNTQAPEFCDAQEWYQGPNKDGINIQLSNPAFDYIYQPTYYEETTPLADNQAFITIKGGIIDSKPYNFTCNDDGTVTFSPTGSKTPFTVVCNKSGETFEYKSQAMPTTGECPDPKIFCKTVNLTLHPFTKDSNPLKEKEIETNDHTLTIVLAVVIPVVIIIILIIVGVVILSRYRIAKKRRQQEDFNRLKAIAASVKNRKRSATSATTGKKPPPPVAGGGEGGPKKRMRASTTAAAPKSFTDAPPDPNEKKEEKTAKGDKLNQILFIEQLEKNREANQKKEAEEKPQDIENAKPTDDLLPAGETRPRKNSL